MVDYDADSHDVRKRKHSDDTTAAIASGTSTPGHQASPPSHSVSILSTPPSSVPSMAASPFTAKSLDNDDLERIVSDAEQPNGRALSRGDRERHTLKRSRVVDLDDHDDEYHEHGPSIVDRIPIVIGDDENEVHVEYARKGRPAAEDTDQGAHDGTYDGDVSSQQVDDDDSVVEVYGGSPPSSNGFSTRTRSRSSDMRGPSPSATHISQGSSDATITPSTIHRALKRSRPLEIQDEPEATPRPRHSSSQNSVEAHSASPIGADDPEVEEVSEVIDLTRPKRRFNYPRGDSLPRVPGLTPQHSFHLPTLQRLVSRSSESMERSQPRRSNFHHSSIDVYEIPDDEEDDGQAEEEEDRFGNDTVRIDNEVREVQLDPRHPWARGPIQLILSPGREGEHSFLEDQRQRRLEDAAVIEDHLAQIDYDDVESESDVEEIPGSQDIVEVEADGVTDQQVQEEANWILNLRRDELMLSPPPPSQRRQTSSFGARSPSFEPRPFSFEARMSPFPTTSRRSTTPQSSNSNRNHRFSPVARRPSPVPLILRSSSVPMSPPPPRARSSSHTSASGAYGLGSSTATTARGIHRRSLKGADGGHKETVAVSVVDLIVDSAPVPPVQTESWARQHLRCSICMEVMNVPTMVRCGHAFCRHCILRALDVTRICPMCRYPTTKNKLQELEFYMGGVRPVTHTDGAGAPDESGGSSMGSSAYGQSTRVAS
ncbi:hypothetical protein EDD11_004721 [Mortierella claussenii]|nr:hypothetical protein EDD11_004721 [Mortierella claussenii]